MSGGKAMKNPHCASTYTQLNQMLLFILGTFITLDHSPELPSTPLILSRKVYCLFFALYFQLCCRRGGWRKGKKEGKE